MAKINGTLLLVYVDGEVIAAQSGVAVNINQELFDASTKDSGGWAEHGNGRRSSDVEIDGLVSTTGKSAKELVAYLNDRKNLVLLIEGGPVHTYLAYGDIASVSLTGPSEEALTVTGSITIDGAPNIMGENLITTLGESDSYDTFTTEGTSVISAINTADDATADSNTISVANGKSYMVFTYLTMTSGESPVIGLYSGTGYISNTADLDEGVNIISLLADTTDTTTTVRISNTVGSNFSLSHTNVSEIITG
jgi:hypothetical protein